MGWGGSPIWSARYLVVDVMMQVRAAPVQTVSGPRWLNLGLSVPRQQQSNWCWAATSDGVARFYDASSPWTQCSIANTDLGRGDCCAGGAGGPCNVYGYLDRSLATVGRFKRWAAEAAPFETVASEMGGARPLGVRVAWEGGGAHFLAIGGCREQPEPYVHVEDPWWGPSDLPYATLTSGYQATGRWTHSYWTGR